MDRLLLVDGHNLLFQMFFGMPERIISKDGRAIQGVVGFVGALSRLIRMCEPTHIGVIFDSETHNPRAECFADYKANRPDYSEMPDGENPFTQLPLIYRALDAVGIRYAEANECECDDIIASYALRYGRESEVVISSFDSDYFQLIGDKVRVIRYRGSSSVICDRDYVFKKCGVYPELYAEHKALVGDTADNIPGVPGIGKVKAAAVLSECGSLERFFEQPELLKSAKIREKLLLARADIERNLSLIRLSGECALPFEIEELRYTGRGFGTIETIREIGL